MQASRDARATLVDLLDRLFDRGLILDADIVITLSGVPLVGLKLRAAIAGIETMLQYGIMQDWDESIRAAERERRKGLVAQPPKVAEVVT